MGRQLHRAPAESDRIRVTPIDHRKVRQRIEKLARVRVYRKRPLRFGVDIIFAVAEISDRCADGQRLDRIGIHRKGPALSILGCVGVIRFQVEARLKNNRVDIIRVSLKRLDSQGSGLVA